ncbi:Protein of unknown function [Bacillus cytotoxicus]|uniref:Uncharacterized protein n=1 Tax=Bacillus cytotoxicus TaxID=580165 RepID=A0AAX2CHI7_9BACI|nr:Protein of unknown function [Bacillus cytotoxicus]
MYRIGNELIQMINNSV